MFGHVHVGNRSVRRWMARTAWLVVLVVTGLAGRAATAQTSPAVITWVRNVEPDEAVLAQPVGLAFSPHADAFYLVEQGAAEGEAASTTLSTLTAYGERLAPVTLGTTLANPLNMTYDSRWQRLLLFDAVHNEWLSLAETDGVLDPATLMRTPAHLDVQQPAGLAFDATNGHLYLLDALGPRLLRVTLAADGSLAGAAVTALALPALSQAQGLAYDPTSGHLHVVAGQTLVELTLNGEVVAERELAEFALGGVGGMVFAPSADLTDDPQQMHLYFADPGSQLPLVPPQTSSLGREIYLPLLATGETAQTPVDSLEPAAQYGQIVEFSLVEMVSPLVQAAAFTPNLVQTMNASLWSPPSPDPSGIVYLPASNTLLVADSEVDEIVTITQSGQLTEVTLYAGANMWHVMPGGGIASNWNTLPFSDEPSGLALNPANRHLFVSDDTGTRMVYEVDPGADGIYGNGNDVVTSFVTGTFGGDRGFGSLDPEGLDYASDLEILLIADGTNNQVYRVSPGINGLFDGVPPTGDDQVTDFDTEILGLTGPEGIARNPDTGNLFLVGSSRSLLFEVTTAGALVRTIDISATNARRPAGLTIAPGSQNPATLSIYIVDRGVDNNTPPDRLPNDGKVYEISLAPVAEDDTAGTKKDTPVTIDVAANDTDVDGNPVSGSVNTACATCSVPSHGTLTNNGDGSFTYTPDTDFSGSVAFVYQICDTWGACDTAGVTITVVSENNAPVADDDSAVTVKDTPVTIEVAANDSDPDGNLVPASANTTCAICTNPSNGSLTNNGDGSFAYTPTPDFSGSDGYVYEICDTDLLCDTAIVTITVTSSNVPPVAVDDSASTSENTMVTTNVVANDTDIDDNLAPASANTTCAACTTSSHGVLVNNGDGTFSYTPNPGFTGSDSFIYQICDSRSLCDTATVTITVVLANSAPVANDDSAVTKKDTLVTIDVVANDTDVDGNLDPGSLSKACAASSADCAGAANGTLTNNGDGGFAYMPNPGFTGVDGFIYEVCDSFAACDTAIVTITVNAVAVPPVANDDSAATKKDTQVTIDVTANDSDPDGNLVPASANTACSTCSVPSHGALTNNGDGSFAYTPDTDFNGGDSSVYEVCDTDLLCDTAIVTITVNGPVVIYLPLMKGR